MLLSARMKIQALFCLPPGEGGAQRRMRDCTPEIVNKIFLIFLIFLKFPLYKRAKLWYKIISNRNHY